VHLVGFVIWKFAWFIATLNFMTYFLKVIEILIIKLNIAINLASILHFFVLPEDGQVGLNML
jgi:hypothetical protein